MKAAYLSVIVTYVSHNRHNERGATAADVFSELQQTVSAMSGHDVLIVLGDFNSRLARGTNGQSGLAQSVIHSRDNNENGKLMRDFLGATGPIEASTRFQPRWRHTMATWISQNPDYFPRQIDHILISGRWVSAVKSCMVR